MLNRYAVDPMSTMMNSKLSPMDDGLKDQDMPQQNNNNWWRGAVVYQVYPRSFQDSNNDGVGDLAGIHSRLDYIASLGVDAIWIAPFFKSPMADFGYDVADPRSVDPLFGNLDDFDRLLKRAHQLGLKVIIDQIPSHTSIEHRWFQESRQSRTNEKAEWYVWADPKEDGTAPNNWLSIFGGSAWQWEPRRQQYYLHNFLASQPDLNFHNPDVREAVLADLRFWLDRGVDGFRLDAINFCFHDAQLRDNPAKPEHLRVGRGYKPDNPYAYQYHHFDNTQPENLAFLESVRELLDEYAAVTSLGEVSSEDSLSTMAEYTKPGRLHMVYSFELLGEDCSASYIRSTIEGLEQKLVDGWPCWAVSNHDVERVASRWGKGAETQALAKQVNALLCSLRGSVCFYQGEELGLPEADLPFEAIQDPYGIAFWPSFKGRDGCRTPMPWDSNNDQAGFSQVKPWLPVVSEHKSLAVARQETDDSSVLNSFRAMMQWRQSMPVLVQGDIQFIDTQEPALAFVRSFEDEKVLVVFNLSRSPIECNIELLKISVWSELYCPGVANGSARDGVVSVPAHGAYFARDVK